MSVAVRVEPVCSLRTRSPLVVEVRSCTESVSYINALWSAICSLAVQSRLSSSGSGTQVLVSNTARRPVAARECGLVDEYCLAVASTMRERLRERRKAAWRPKRTVSSSCTACRFWSPKSTLWLAHFVCAQYMENGSLSILSVWWKFCIHGNANFFHHVSARFLKRSIHIIQWIASRTTSTILFHDE